MKYLLLILTYITSIQSFSQKNEIIIPEEISQKCPDIPLSERIRVTVAEFANSTNGVKAKSIDNFASMLSNALFKVNCYRVLAMKKDDNILEGTGSRSLRPHAVVTGEITEYFHEETSRKVMMKTTLTTVAHIGIIVQLRNNLTGDILFSESINTNGEAQNSELKTEVKIPGKLGKVLGPQTVGTQSSGNIDAAYQDALEKAIIATVALMVDNSQRVSNEVWENIPEDYDQQPILSSSNHPTTEVEMSIQNASFAGLTSLENKYKGSSFVNSVAKTLKNGVGQLKIMHNGNSDDLVNIVMSFGDKFEIVGLDEGKISINEKK